MYIPRNIIKIVDKLIEPFVKFTYEKLGLKPDHLTLISFILSLLAATFFYLKLWVIAFLLLALSVIFDGLDGSMARKYKLVSEKGYIKDTLSDRISEFLIFFSLTLNGSVSIKLFLLLYYAIILNTLLRKKSKLDLGFKRTTLFLGIILKFDIVFAIIFIVNLLCFMLQIVIIDYKYDKKLLKEK